MTTVFDIEYNGQNPGAVNRCRTLSVRAVNWIAFIFTLPDDKNQSDQCKNQNYRRGFSDLGIHYASIIYFYGVGFARELGMVNKDNPVKLNIHLLPEN
jgi:hypothetical protein